ncbi:MAG: hypothetical protein AAGF95_13750 [Chloroflexota bacterium]
MKTSSLTASRHPRYIWLISLLLISLLFSFLPTYVNAEGSRNLYPEGATGSRANIEWRNSTYAGILFRRTLLKVYARAGEYILLGSSAVDVPDTPDNGDILIYDTDDVTGPVGEEELPDTPLFSCLDQRADTGNALGRIGSRLQEVSGPDTIDPATAVRGNDVPNGYVPCFYQAPETGIYTIVFYGPEGDDSNAQDFPTGSIPDASFTAQQRTSVNAWDVTIRPDSTSTANEATGRLFADYLAMYTGGNNRPVNSTLYVVTEDGFQYQVDMRGMDPYGYLLFANRSGFLDSDGETPLYHDVLAIPTLDRQGQNQLLELQGGVSIAPPEHPLFFTPPDPAVLEEIGYPIESTVPTVEGFTFAGANGNNVISPGEGGTFTFVSSVDSYSIVISRDGVDFDPTNPENRFLRGNGIADLTNVEWDGLDNSGSPFTEGTYTARIQTQGGEMHFPFLDVENSAQGGPTLTLINPPDINGDGNGDCPDLNGECSGGFYDDRGYRTTGGEIVGTGVNEALCDAFNGVVPDPLFSDPIRGFDTRTNQRVFSGAGPTSTPDDICDPDGGLGDKKGLDLWTFYASEPLAVSIIISDPTAIELKSFTATQQPDSVDVRWETSAEINTWGFHLLRSTDGTRANAEKVTPNLILAKGRGQGGATYGWTDTDVAADTTYTYWLQETELNGRIIEYGPATTRNPANIAGRIFLPFLQR